MTEDLFGWKKTLTCVSMGTGDEYYTPGHIVELARKAMGGIDLDPASNERAQEVVRAGAYYTKDTNGLDKPWYGNVWLNPPYSKKNIGAFCNKLLDEISRGNTKQACVLTHNSTDSGWAIQLFSVASMVCFLHDRVRFYGPVIDSRNGGDSPTRGQMVCYFGTDHDRFLTVFSPRGTIMTINHTQQPKHQLTIGL